MWWFLFPLLQGGDYGGAGLTHCPLPAVRQHSLTTSSWVRALACRHGIADAGSQRHSTRICTHVHTCPHTHMHHSRAVWLGHRMLKELGILIFCKQPLTQDKLGPLIMKKANFIDLPVLRSLASPLEMASSTSIARPTLTHRPEARAGLNELCRAKTRALWRGSVVKSLIGQNNWSVRHRSITKEVMEARKAGNGYREPEFIRTKSQE